VTWASGKRSNINDLRSIEGMADTGARRGLFEGGLLKSISDVYIPDVKAEVLT